MGFRTNLFLGCLVFFGGPAVAIAGNAIDLNDLQSSFAGASATFSGFEGVQLISTPSVVAVKDAKGNKICTCGTTSTGALLVNCLEKTVTIYTAVLTFDSVVADFPYMVEKGKTWIKEGDTGYASAPFTQVILTLPLGEIDPGNLGAALALKQGHYSNINQMIAQAFLTADPGTRLSISQARMDIRVSDVDGNTHASVLSGHIQEITSPSHSGHQGLLGT